MKSVLITGCSDGGIGSGLATVFQRQGYHVFATARNTSKMSDLKDLPNVDFLTLDVTDATQIQAAVDAVAAATGGTLDYLVNNAGHNQYMPILDEDIQNCRALFETNVWGPLALTQALSPLIIKAKGTIAYTSSLAAHSSTPYIGIYGASKKSLELIHDTLRTEMAPFGVRVLCIVTGTVKTLGHTYFEDLKLPEGSRYKKIENNIISRAQGNDGIAREDRIKYCEKVVKALTTGRSGHAWFGGMAGTMWLLEKFMPNWLMDKTFRMGTGLDELWEKKE